MGIQAVMNDLGWLVKLRVSVDATVAKSVASRIGLGKIRHLDVKYLWVQGAVKTGRFVIKKVRGEDIPADVLT